MMNPLLLQLGTVLLPFITNSEWMTGNPSMPFTPHLSGAGYYQNRIYIIGIENGNQLTEYDIDTNTFKYNSTFASNTDLFGQSQWWVQLSDTLFMADPYDGYIHTFNLKSKIFTPRAISDPATFAGDMYACLAASNDEKFLYYLGGSPHTDRVSILSLSDGSWSIGPRMNLGRATFSCMTAPNGKLYVIGGNVNTDYFDEVEVIQTAGISGNTWTVLNDTLIAPMAATRTIKYMDYLYIIPGHNWVDGIYRTDTVQIIDTLTDRISIAPDSLVLPLSYMTPIIVNDTIYAFGGWDGPLLNIWQKYTISPSTFEPSITPSSASSNNPTVHPTKEPSINPTSNPTSDSTLDPTADPSHYPSEDPTFNPITNDPTPQPALNPTVEPTNNPSTTAPTSNMLVFESTVSSHDKIKNTESKPVEATLNDFFSIQNPMFIAISIGIICMCLCIVVVVLMRYLRRIEKKLSKIQPNSAPKQLSVYIDNIQNGLVAIISIGKYDKPAETESSDLIGNNFMDLPVEKDVDNLTKLFQILKYTVIPHEIKLHWTQKEVLEFLQETGKSLFSDDACNHLMYDGLIVCITSHGIEDHIVTSDYKAIKKKAIHRLLSMNYPKIRDIPRIFLYDSCDGNADMNHMIKQMSTLMMDKGKYFGMEELEMTAPIALKETWTDKTNNPDYKLVEIHAANTGFQAKLSPHVGSYMLYEFTKRMKLSILNDEDVTLGRLFDKIQNDLHEHGKQQIVKVFNNDTSHIRLKICNEEKRILMDENEGMQEAKGMEINDETKGFEIDEDETILELYELSPFKSTSL